MKMMIRAWKMAKMDWRISYSNNLRSTFLILLGMPVVMYFVMGIEVAIFYSAFYPLLTTMTPFSSTREYDAEEIFRLIPAKPGDEIRGRLIYTALNIIIAIIPMLCIWLIDTVRGNNMDNGVAILQSSLFMLIIAYMLSCALVPVFYWVFSLDGRYTNVLIRSITILLVMAAVSQMTGFRLLSQQMIDRVLGDTSTRWFTLLFIAVLVFVLINGIVYLIAKKVYESRRA